ncbi:MULTISPECIES: hypothetical protein [unclassified Streptomyces]|uniref:hypothetical protein n=1 Tax=unclassified Streptomyces TaxID=2593676 RepID=UPI002E354FB8|nr:hypothetical protein [Streptomyces sp. NBC_01280]
MHAQRDGVSEDARHVATRPRRLPTRHLGEQPLPVAVGPRRILSTRPGRSSGSTGSTFQSHAEHHVVNRRSVLISVPHCGHG